MVGILALQVALAYWTSCASGQLLDGPVDLPLLSQPYSNDNGPATWTGAWQQVPEGPDAISGYSDFGRQLSDAGSSPGAGSPSTQSFVLPPGLQSPKMVDEEIGWGVSCSTCGGQTFVACPGCLHSRLFSSLGGRRQGMGQPLRRESWRYRPFSAGWLMGLMLGSPLIDDWIGMKEGFVGGYRLGWDFDHRWGCEMQFGFASVGLYDSDRAKQAQLAADALLNLAADDPYLTRFEQRRDADVSLWDIHFLYYPWGDATWRPYGSIGLGSAHVRFMDRLGDRYSKSFLGLPLALGLKYRCNDWLALRLEVSDNMAFGGGPGFNMLHNLSATGGLEVRFGGTRKVYWPYSPGRHYW